MWQLDQSAWPTQQPFSEEVPWFQAKMLTVEINESSHHSNQVLSPWSQMHAYNCTCRCQTKWSNNPGRRENIAGTEVEDGQVLFKTYI